MPADFVRDALAKGDECYAVLDGDRLANYGWYSRLPTNIEDDLRFCFDPAYVYMYKGFTPPEYRGQRLHAVSMTRALQAYRQRGAKGLVSYVESNNFNSLKSCARMGYEVAGTIVVARLFGHYLSVGSPHCREYGVALEAVRPGTGAWAEAQLSGEAAGAAH